MGVTIVAQAENSEASTIAVNRPKWDDVYEGYPKNASGTDDLGAEDVFRSVLGDKYYEEHAGVFTNACATRVSLGLINGGMTVKREYNIINSNHAHNGKGFAASAINLKNWLSRDAIWGEADEIIEGPTSLSDVANTINERNGVYILIPYPGCFDTATGHATLWIGSDNDVIGGHNYAQCAGEIYFWELK